MHNKSFIKSMCVKAPYMNFNKLNKSISKAQRRKEFFVKHCGNNQLLNAAVLEIAKSI